MDLFDFAYCGNYYKQIASLSLLAPEKWSFGTNNDNGILKNYIEHTFRRLYDEGKVVEKDTYAVFNTGLFDSYYQRLCAYFTVNKVPGKQKWYLDGFYTEYQLANVGVSDVPPRANYFTEPSELIYDVRLKIVPQYDHIFGDIPNLERFPDSIKNSATRIQQFDGAVATSLRMLEANYKTAVPQFYRGKLQLLIPIYLLNLQEPNLALACEKKEDGSCYLGRTCLTMEMAYNNARLIAKPESEWLRA